MLFRALFLLLFCASCARSAKNNTKASIVVQDSVKFMAYIFEI